MPTETNSAIAQKLGRYEIEAELGSGAMGTVYRARDPKICRTVAVKTIHIAKASAVEEREHRERILREAQSAGKLSHPGIVTIYDAGEDETTSTPYIVMEYVEGKTLEALLSDSGANAITCDAKFDLGRQIAEALDYAHGHDVIHRDIKPANILVDAHGHAKIADFGIAKQLRSEFTVAGLSLGTPSYMSPEQLQGKPLDGRSDLFSLGVVLYWMFTGQKPFAGETPEAIAFQVVFQDPQPATQIAPSLPAEIDTVLRRALAKDTEQRYARGSDLAHDLEALRTWHHSTATPVPVREAAASGTVILPSQAQHIVSSGEKEGNSKARAFLGTLTHASSNVWNRRHKFASTTKAGWEKMLAFVRQSPMRAGIISALAALLCLLPVTLESSHATLHLEGQHPFHSGEITVFQDGHKVYSGELHGMKRSTLGVFHRVEGNISEDISVPTGKHDIRVRVTAPEDHFDESSALQTNFVSGEDKVLRVEFVRGGDIYLEWLGDNAVSSGDPSAPQSEHSSPIVLTILGSSVSAFMGWLIPTIMRLMKQLRSTPQSVA
ncbi:MAG TPA: serine/threonine-protein kinase [Terriglobales bacterium]|nr:serine/threonine-protein kinase [Terriglobales bacterium]